MSALQYHPPPQAYQQPLPSPFQPHRAPVAMPVHVARQRPPVVVYNSQFIAPSPQPTTQPQSRPERTLSPQPTPVQPQSVSAQRLYPTVTPQSSSASTPAVPPPTYSQSLAAPPLPQHQPPMPPSQIPAQPQQPMVIPPQRAPATTISHSAPLQPLTPGVISNNPLPSAVQQQTRERNASSHTWQYNAIPVTEVAASTPAAPSSGADIAASSSVLASARPPPKPVHRSVGEWLLNAPRMLLIPTDPSKKALDTAAAQQTAQQTAAEQPPPPPPKSWNPFSLSYWTTHPMSALAAMTAIRNAASAYKMVKATAMATTSVGWVYIAVKGGWIVVSPWVLERLGTYGPYAGFIASFF